MLTYTDIVSCATKVQPFDKVVFFVYDVLNIFIIIHLNIQDVTRIGIYLTKDHGYVNHPNISYSFWTHRVKEKAAGRRANLLNKGKSRYRKKIYYS